MAVTAADLTAPAGRLDRAVLFPSDDASAFTTRLEAYIDEGEAEATGVDASDQDAAVTAWAYYRAYDAVYQRYAAQATSITLADQGSKTYALGQADRFKALADEYRAVFDGFLAPDATTPAAPLSAPVRNEFTW